MAESTPPGAQPRITGPAPPSTSAATTSSAPIARAASSRRGIVSTATTSAPARVASLVASNPITPWPKTATRSPSRASAASTALSAIDPTRANVPEIASSAVQTRSRTAAAGTTASLRCPQMPWTTSPTPRCVHVVGRPPRPRPPRSSPSPRPGRRRSALRRRRAGVRRPRSGEVGVGAAVRRQLGPGRDAGVPRADAHRARQQRLGLARDQRDLVGGGERHDVGHGVSSWTVGLASGVSPSRRRR